jgi:hypothetical protein
MSAEPEPVNIDIETEAKAVAQFYRTLMDELHDNQLAHDLTMAYVQSFNRRIG